MKLMFLFFKTLDEWAILIHSDCGLSRVPGNHEFINLYCTLFFIFAWAFPLYTFHVLGLCSFHTFSLMDFYFLSKKFNDLLYTCFLLF